MAVIYKYKDENEVYIGKANRYTYLFEVDTNYTTWGGIGTMFNADTNEELSFLTHIYDFEKLGLATSSFEFKLHPVYYRVTKLEENGYKDYIYKYGDFWYLEVSGTVFSTPELKVDSNPLSRGGIPRSNIIPAFNITYEELTNYWDTYILPTDKGEIYQTLYILYSELNRNSHSFIGFPKILVQPHLKYKNIYDKPIIKKWYPVRAKTIVELKIFLNDTEVFSRKEYSRAEYVYPINRKCPDNTCPVKCDENVCCYNSKGIATESFLFEESIYQ